MGRSRIERRAREIEAFLAEFIPRERPGLVCRTTAQLVEIYNQAGDWLKPPISGIDNADFAALGRRDIIGAELDRRFGKGTWYANGRAFIPAQLRDDQAPKDATNGP
jgi:hypothetical protein